jgi:hypothetical protein
MIMFAPIVLALQSAPAAVAPTETPPAEKKVCKRVVETGSLVKGKKVCMTRKEWNAVADNARQQGQDMQEQNGRIYTPQG